MSDGNTIAACAKHFAAYGYSESGREYNTVEISENTLRNVVLPPFKAAVEEANVATVMNSFNDVNGVAATGNAFLQRKILKGEWDFQGFVVSDWASIGEMVEHGMAEDLKQAANYAVKAGSDMDMESGAYIFHLKELIEAEKVDVALIDEAVRRILTLKIKLGLFDDPYLYSNAKREKKEVYTKEHLEIARDAGRKSIVLLKNETKLLPLSDQKTIGVIGPLADDKDSPLGNWRAQADPNTAVSLLEGVKAAVTSGTKVLYAEGCKITNGPREFVARFEPSEYDRSGFAKAIEVAKKSDVVLLAIGEDCFESGEARSKTDISISAIQRDLLDEILKVNKNVVVILSNGRPLVLTDIVDKVPAILETWYLGSQSGHAIADVLFGHYNPSGKLTMSFPYTVGQLPLYYAQKSTGRPGSMPKTIFKSHFMDAPNDGLFPFGYGLSYTTFEYGEPKVSAEKVNKGEEVTVTISVTNTGDRAGEEVVQLYINDVAASTIRPMKELKGFEKIALQSKETKEVTFTLTDKELGFYGIDGAFVVEAGTFKVFVGASSADVQETQFVLVDDVTLGQK